MSNNTELTALHKAAANAFRLYAKTRPAPSLESSKRSKGLPREGLHPRLREKVRNVEAELAAFTERLKAIRFSEKVSLFCFVPFSLRHYSGVDFKVLSLILSVLVSRPKQTVIESEAEAAKGKHKKVCFLWHSYLLAIDPMPVSHAFWFRLFEEVYPWSFGLFHTSHIVDGGTDSNC